MTENDFYFLEPVVYITITYKETEENTFMKN